MTTTGAPQQVFGQAFGPNPTENYERYFVPAIGAPLATTLIGWQPWVEHGVVTQDQELLVATARR